MDENEAREMGASGGLLPIQIEALHFLAQCNRYSDTVQGVSEFLGQTKGTVSQTIKVLENKSLVEKRPDPKDRRLVHLRITSAGRRVLDQVVPARLLVDALALESEDDVIRLMDALKRLLLAAQKARGKRSFGTCRSCRFNERADGAFRCGLTGEPLSENEIQLICREHQHSSPKTEEA